MQILSSIWGIFAAVPFLAFLVVYVLIILVTKDKRMAMQWAVTITNVFLIQFVTLAYHQIWPNGLTVWLWIAFLYVTLAGLVAWLQKKKRGQIRLAKIIFSIWRISFLFFSLAYILLFGTGIWKLMQIS